MSAIRAASALRRGWREPSHALLLALTFVVAGCGGGGGSDGGSTPPPLPPAAIVPPSILAAPSNVLVSASTPVSFSVTASGTPPLSYQWLDGGVAMPGQTGSTLTLPLTRPEDDRRQFSVVVSNAAGRATSWAATLSVFVPVVEVRRHPQNAFTSVGGSVSFSVQASTNATNSNLAHQWQRDGVDIAGATLPSYTLAPVSIADHGARFSVRVSEMGGQSKSSVAATLLVDASGKVAVHAGTVDGSGNIDGPRHVARFIGAPRLALDPRGRLLVADLTLIRMIDTTGQVSTLAGQRGPWPRSREGNVFEAQFYNIVDFAVDGDHNIYLIDDNAVRRITRGGSVLTLAGALNPTPYGSSSTVGSADGPGAQARFAYPGGIAVAPDGAVYVADAANRTIRKISPDGVVTTLAGQTGASGSVDGIGNAARFVRPERLAIGPDGVLYVLDTSDSSSTALRAVKPDGSVSTLAFGSSQSGESGPIGSLQAIAVGPDGNIYVANPDRFVLRVTPAGRVSAIGLSPRPFAGSCFYRCGMAVEAGGHILLSMGSAIWRIAPDGSAIELHAGVGTQSPASNNDLSDPMPELEDIADAGQGRMRGIYYNDIFEVAADGSFRRWLSEGPAGARWRDTLDNPQSAGQLVNIVVDRAGITYFQEGGAVRKISPDRVVSALAGLPGELGQQVDGVGAAARFGRWEHGTLVADSHGNLHLADGCTVRRITPGGEVSTEVGDPLDCARREGMGRAARLPSARGLAIDGQDHLYVLGADAVVSRITPDGNVVTWAGQPHDWVDPSMSDGVGTLARFGAPDGIAANPAGEVFVRDRNTIRRIGTDRSVTTRVGTPDLFGFGGPPAAGVLPESRGRMLWSEGALYLKALTTSDALTGVLIRVTP